MKKGSGFLHQSVLIGFASLKTAAGFLHSCYAFCNARLNKFRDHHFEINVFIKFCSISALLPEIYWTCDLFSSHRKVPAPLPGMNTREAMAPAPLIFHSAQMWWRHMIIGVACVIARGVFMEGTVSHAPSPHGVREAKNVKKSLFENKILEFKKIMLRWRSKWEKSHF